MKTIFKYQVIRFLLLSVLFLGANSCKKHDAEVYVNANTWRIDSTEYHVQMSYRGTYSVRSIIQFSDPWDDVLGIQFYSRFPTESGTYKITDSPRSEKELCLGTSESFSNLRESFNAGYYCQLVIGESGKISIMANRVPLIKQSATNDTSYCSFNLQE